MSLKVYGFEYPIQISSLIGGLWLHRTTTDVCVSCVYFGWVWNIYDLFFLKILEVKSKYGQLRWKESKYMKFIVVSFDAYVSCGSLHISKIKYGQLKWKQSRLIGLAVHLLVLANECNTFGLCFWFLIWYVFVCNSSLSPRKSPIPRWTSCPWWPTCRSSPRPNWSPGLPSDHASTQTVSAPMDRVWSPRATRSEHLPASPWKPSVLARDPWRSLYWTPKERKKL